MFVLWVRLSINLWSMNVTSCYLERRSYLSQDYNRAIRRLLKSSLQQRFTLVQEVSYSNQEEPDLYECHFDTYRVLSFGEILCTKYSLEMIFLNFSLNLKNSKGIYALVNKKSKNQHVMKYKTLECPF